MNELTIIESMDLQQVGNTMNNIAKFQAILQSQLKKGHDYDVIPGTNKPTLLKPGAEKTLMLLGLTSEYDVIEKVEDYQKGIFAYTVKCILIRSGNKITEGLGSCNSKEDKYRWRWAKENELPAGLDKDTLKSKTNDYGTTRYRVENDDICSQANTILKMAKKRAQIDATLTVAALSEVFTQDLEDMRDFIQAEKLDNLKDDEAGNIRINFGKYKGQTLQEVAKADIGYVRWIAEKGNDEVMRKAAEMILNGKQEPSKDVYVGKGDKPQDDVPPPWVEGGQANE